MQVRKFISQLSEQLKQFWRAWLRFDSGFGFVVTHLAHVAINTIDHSSLKRGNASGLTRELPSITLMFCTNGCCSLPPAESIFSNDQLTLPSSRELFCSFTCPLIPSLEATQSVKLGWRTEDALSESGLIRTQFGSRGLYQQALGC